MTLEPAIRRAFAVFRDVARDPARFREDVLVIPLESLLETEGTPFTKQRLRLLLEIRRRPAESLDHLAAALHREKTRVSKDIKFLEGIGLVQSRKVGKAKRLEPTGQAILLA